jgi:hypothetical protein
MMRSAGAGALHTGLKAGQLPIALALAIIFAACKGTASTDLLSAELDDGRQLQALAKSDRPGAILIYDAATCFTCGTAVPQWRRLMNDSRVHVAVVLAGAVTEADLRALRIQRIPIAGTMKKPPFGREAMPVEILTVDGHSHAAAIGAEAVHTRRLWAHLVPLLEAPAAAVSLSPGRISEPAQGTTR